MILGDYELTIHWSWGSDVRLREQHVMKFLERPTEDQIYARMRVWWPNVLRRYEFDCGRTDMPMYPSVSYLKLRRVERCDDVAIDLSEFSARVTSS